MLLLTSEATFTSWLGEREWHSGNSTASSACPGHVSWVSWAKGPRPPALHQPGAPRPRPAVIGYEFYTSEAMSEFPKDQARKYLQHQGKSWTTDAFLDAKFERIYEVGAHVGRGAAYMCTGARINV